MATYNGGKQGTVQAMENREYFNALIIKTMGIYQERENLRNQIRTFWKEGGTWTEKEQDVSNRLNLIHAEIVAAELLDNTRPSKRIVYSVCGWSEKHEFFREKRFKAETIIAAKKELEIAKKEIDWNIPTIIIKETYFRETSPAIVDFDGDFNNLDFSDTQELIEKSMCGNRHFKWKDLINNTHDRFTY